MTRQYIRIWQWIDLSEIRKQLIIIGDTMGDCANCKEFGIDIRKTAECPQCHTIFKYAASRRSASYPGERFQVVKRLLELKADFQVIDYEDYQKLTGSQKAKDFFNS